MHTRRLLLATITALVAAATLAGSGAARAD